jgi:trimethyllysine dioxygenase
LVSQHDSQLNISWTDGHNSVYSLDWLFHNSYDPHIPVKESKKSKEILWNKKRFFDFKPKEISISYNEAMKDDNGLAEWLKKIKLYGLCFIDDVPVCPEKTEELARRISFLRETHYGIFWDFTSSMSKNDTAYSTLGISAHTDTTYFTDPVGLQLFHLLKHEGEGGNTLLVDGFYIAERIKMDSEKYFKVLSSTPVPTHSAGEQGTFIMPTPRKGFPIIQCRPNSQIPYQIRYNNADRSVLSGEFFSAQDIENFYDALFLWTKYIENPENEIRIKMKPGRAVILNNWRVLHGRSAFTGYRRMCGAYLNNDDFNAAVQIKVNQGIKKKYL